MNVIKLQYVLLPAMLIALLALGCVPNQKNSEGDEGPNDPPPVIEPGSETGPNEKDPETTEGGEVEPPVEQSGEHSVDTEEARTANSAIGKLGGTEDEVEAATRVLETMGPSATQYLVNALNDSSPVVRQRILFMLLARFNPANARMTAAVIKSLGDSSAEVRHMALRAVDQIEDPMVAAPAVEHLVKMLEQEQKALVRAHVARVLGRLGEHSKPSFSVLQKAMLEDDDRAVRFAAFKAIRQVGATDVETVAALVALLEHSDDVSLRVQVVRRLPDYGKLACVAVPVLVKLLYAPDEKLPLAASNTLAGFGEASVQELIQTLDAQPTKARVMAAVTLGNIGPEAAGSVERLTQALEDDQEAVRQAANIALRKIVPNP